MRRIVTIIVLLAAVLSCSKETGPVIPEREHCVYDSVDSLLADTVQRLRDDACDSFWDCLLKILDNTGLSREDDRITVKYTVGGRDICCITLVRVSSMEYVVTDICIAERLRFLPDPGFDAATLRDFLAMAVRRESSEKLREAVSRFNSRHSTAFSLDGKRLGQAGLELFEDGPETSVLIKLIYDSGISVAY